jgi:hypothetical protein
MYINIQRYENYFFSSAELRNNMKKYLDLAGSETVVIQRGKTETFVLARQDNLPEDFYRGITKDELMKGIEQDLRKIYHK